MKRPFRAVFRRAVDGFPDYVLVCNQCETRERCFGAKPHDVAKVHAQFWHPGPRIPVGWANPGGQRPVIPTPKASATLPRPKPLADS